jgi:beta-galactosidase
MTAARGVSQVRRSYGFKWLWLVAMLMVVWSPCHGAAADSYAVALPDGVRAVWDTAKAHRETTLTRERICLNGLWAWQPADPKSDEVPANRWGYFKVPGSWPGITSYEQKDSQTVHAHPSWNKLPLGVLSAAWYEREFTVPEAWSGRRISLTLDYLNSYAVVHVDRVQVGEVRFPGGEVDLTSTCSPGERYRLSVLVVAMPLRGVTLSYTDSASAREIEGTVARRGLCGDVYLVGEPPAARISDVRVETSVRLKQITVDTALEGLVEGAPYTLRARVTSDGRVIKTFFSSPFSVTDLIDGRFVFTTPWMPERLWDVHTPGHVHDLELSLRDGAEKSVDVHWNVRFGFREFWIEDRDFYLNGTRVYLSMVPLDNAQVGAALTHYQAARESLERLKDFGINFVYTHNYGCEPGAHLGFDEILRAADDTGMLIGFSQPHFSHYDWEAPEADLTNGYARHAAFYVRAAQNHPSIVAYAMSHNATGYSEDMNPDMIDGIQDRRDAWALRNVKLAQRTEAIVKRLDPSRVVYHHASGNLGPLHAINFYPNFVPIQELSDWFGHWAHQGVKPVFLCEYGAPFTWDWTMYRGWYQGEREFGSAKVPWEFCIAEWNAQYLGDGAFPISEPEKSNLRWEAAQFRAGRLWHRWDYPHPVGSTRFHERYPVFAAYLTDNWRAFRTWGVSAISPWEHGHFWTLRDGVTRGRRELPVDWENLQQPGFSPDYVDQRYERVDLAFDRSDWIATPAADALVRNNRPLLAYVAGQPDAFTSKDHNSFPGQTLEKQLIIINNSRQTVTCHARWSLNLPRAITGHRHLTVPTGQQARVPLHFELPSNLPPGSYELEASVEFNQGETQHDRFSIDVIPALSAVDVDGNIALFDPMGETRRLLADLGIRSQTIDENADLSGYDLLIVGKGALGLHNPAPNISAVRDGLRVVLFEQTAASLERRLGFRVAEYGLRQVFPRVPNHPLLSGLSAAHLRDWRGEATIQPPRLDYELRPRHGPTVTWCGIPVTRLWRCGNRGNVASVLIEKPTRGDFLPVLDGGYSLQYSPLLEYREGQGMMLFCQLDLTGRTESDPAAEALVRNILRYASSWKPASRRTLRYVGEPDGQTHLALLGLKPDSFDNGILSPDDVLVLGPGAGGELGAHAVGVTDWIKAGGHVLGIGLDPADARGWLPLELILTKSEHISTSFDPFEMGSPFAGIGPADVHNRDPRELWLISKGARVAGNGVLATTEELNVAFCQLVPWQFAPTRTMNLRRTHRRASFVISRLLANLGVAGSSPLLDRFARPIKEAESESRWLDGFYLDEPEEWDDPYRFFRW